MSFFVLHEGIVYFGSSQQRNKKILYVIFAGIFCNVGNVIIGTESSKL